MKFNANQEYEYQENYRILQNAITKHNVDRFIDPPRMMKCRFQDNFEFTNWLKQHWETYSTGQPYDALARRQGKPMGAAATNRPISSASGSQRSTSSTGAYRTGTGRPNVVRAGGVVGAGGRGVGGGAVRPGSRTMASGGGGASQQRAQELARQLADAKALIETAEKERDFYFGKLREIEVYIQQADFDAGSQAENLAKYIQNILYSTEDGAEDDIMAEEMVHDEQMPYQDAEDVQHHPHHMQHVDENETF